ncbi:MAG: alpha/beta fold hydrolase [Nocardioides sp.]
MGSPLLKAVSEPARPEAVVLALHGGASRPDRPDVHPAQLSVLRMVPLARRIARAGRGRLAVYRLLNSSRGWDTSHTPVDDVRWALARLRETYGDLPVGLVGHSLGGRAALLAGAEPEVRCVVALNPWVYPDDPRGPVDVAELPVLIVHGTADRIADPARARIVASTLARSAAVDFREVVGGKHAMLRQSGEFERPAAAYLVSHLLD